jgi:DNA polymerase-3 subunit alpha
MNGFTHLHVHSEYSLLDGAARITDLVDRAAELGMTALALTDHGVMYGAVAFYKACRARGIKPIIGCEAYYTSGSRRDKGPRQDNPIYHLILLARNMEGYRNLMRLTSIAHLEGYHYKPRIDREVLERHAEGLIALSACLGGEVAQHLLNGRYEQAKQAAERYRDIFGENFYLELQDHGLMEQKTVNRELIRLSQETGIPLVATNDVHYIREEDHIVQDILICIGTGKTLESEDRLKFTTRQMYLKSAEEMAALFPHVPEALANTQRIADLCELELPLGRAVLPAYRPLPEGHDAESYLRALCREGLRERYAGRPEWREDDYRNAVTERLEYELSVICKMGFADYFLIVWDFMRFSREQGIAVGPGRGSSAGSLVAYVFRITDIDPIRYRLLFERFLNPERISMPDIDIDFSDERRDEVIRYVSQKYGAEHVAQIITFGTMAARAAVRDVGRVLDLPYAEVDRTAKMIPSHPGVTIEDALRENPELAAYVRANEQAARLIRYARRVEGMPRHASTHAAGVVISREPLTHYTPLQEGTEHAALTQYSMEHLEAIGLLKMDFLGLRTLSIIERTLDWIEEETGERPDLQAVDDGDPDTYELLSRGETTGIFQLESPGMRRVLRELKPSRFEDIISVLALYRPGPMEFIPKFIQARHGLAQVEYPHPVLEPILKETFGIIVYQEQIMQIAATMAGFSLGEADLLRRAVTKKNRKVLDEQRAHFVTGCLRQGFGEEDANRVYDMIVRFADYGFPRAHATAYGVLAFRTAYLKCHYPAAFMAAMLTSVMGNHRKVAEYVEECRRIGIPVLPPDVNESTALFTPVAHTDQATGRRTNAVRFGLAAIKNVGFQAIDAIVRERANGPYESLLDFCRRIDLRACNKRVIESLIAGGAFDRLPGDRAQKLAAMDEMIEAAVKWKKEREELQLSLFGFQEQANWTVELPDVPPLPAAKQLEMEKEMLGLYLSGHPLDPYEEALARFEPTPIPYLAELEEGAAAVIAGMVVACKPVMTRKGQAMAFLEVEDRIDRVEVVVFPEAWRKYGELAQRGRLVLVAAKVQHDDEREAVKLIADRMYPVERLPSAPLKLMPERGRRAAAGHGRTPPASGTAAAGAATAGGAAAGGSAVPGAEPAGAATARAAAAGAAAVGAASSNAADSPAARPRPAPRQRVYIKIAADREQPERLQRLKTLLRRHRGPLEVILFYEGRRQTIMLSDDYHVRPSPELFRQVAELFGEGSAKVR